MTRFAAIARRICWIRRLSLALGAVALSVALAPAAASAETFPARPIRLIVPFAPGGSVDIAARLITEAWGRQLGQPVVADNRAGASGNIGMDQTAKAKPDGYTLAINNVALAVNPSLFAKLPFDTERDLMSVGTMGTSQHVLVVTNSLPAKDVKALIALAKSRPGQLSFGSAGTGSTFHMAAELFKSESGTAILHVPYKGGGPAMVDTIAGQVQLSFPVLSAALPQVQAGKLRALAVTGPKRSPLLPDVPTIAEAGLPNYAFETWFIVSAPAGTPKDVIARLNQTLNQALAAPEIKARLLKEGFEPLSMSPSQADAMLHKEIKRWAAQIKQAGITPE
ncbi:MULTISPECIES: tripartite tricarboxylate transporter substrate binding protein [unclassified Cupriavidus]|uniref:tripartite tricarboxylate transporter substrate binding protein n=1 Tax=Cupriavidus TaxID=106589 RepID=UPI00226DEA15|nr:MULTISPECIES: tripartite tricarboxylate transporter substrate binding protein [unclassified Cupriavidus]MCY0857502.1 tripartite tricarboxylate transporter substrate binding protein [Cupriavidus sp. D39]MDW3683988.1 tripartite tricarboxylate transporter substrate binding protein [Cupriavidus sp. CV2]